MIFVIKIFKNISRMAITQLKFNFSIFVSDIFPHFFSIYIIIEWNIVIKSHSWITYDIFRRTADISKSSLSDELASRQSLCLTYDWRTFSEQGSSVNSRQGRNFFTIFLSWNFPSIFSFLFFASIILFAIFANVFSFVTFIYPIFYFVFVFVFALMNDFFFIFSNHEATSFIIFVNFIIIIIFFTFLTML